MHVYLLHIHTVSVDFCYCNMKRLVLQLIEMQRYTLWVYQNITSFVSRYSDILPDTVQLIFGVQNHHVLYLPNSYRTMKLAHNHSVSHKTVHIICSVKVKTHMDISSTIFDISRYSMYRSNLKLILYHWLIVSRYGNTSIYCYISTS